MVTEDKALEVTDLLLVRATVNLPGLPYDQAACVDPTLPTIGVWLNAGYLVALPQDLQHHCDDVEAIVE
jgi:hypothetical protein